MKFFTSNLLSRLNSQDPSVVAGAMKAWDEQEARYERHLQELRARLPVEAFQLATTATFHDAQILSLSYNDADKFSILLRQRDELHVLTFTLTGKPLLVQPKQPPVFATDSMQWLYEELDLSRQRPVMRVLISDGSELSIGFSELSLQSFGVQEQAVKANGKKAKRSSQRAPSTTAIFDHLTPALTHGQPATKVNYAIEVRVGK